MIYDVTKGHIMQKLSLYDPTTNKYTYSYNWIGESNIPKVVVDDKDCPLIKFGSYCSYKAKGVLTSDPTELYTVNESDKTERQATLQEMVKYFSYGNIGNMDMAAVVVAKKDVSVFGLYSDNKKQSFYYELNGKRSLLTNIVKNETENISQKLVSQTPFYLTYDNDAKKYKITYGIGTGYSGAVFCTGTTYGSGWWYDYRDSTTYPIMYQYYKKIKDAFDNNNAQSVALATKLQDYRAWSDRRSNNVKIEENMCSFFDSDPNNCAGLKEVLSLYNDVKNSSSKTERNKASEEFDKMYIVKWLADCFEAGDIVDDKVNYDDRIDYYARIDNNETIAIDWVNKAVDSGQLEITEKSMIKIKFMVRTQHAGVQDLDDSAP